ncbi:hypothetical protein [Bartonella sp. AR 15-3]|uniref:hypothetical protein n=1 Tax=Bartonella sp. AR 15-3 TaxID=545617 RepID=UPI0001F4BF61|nr:hypothetical protein [Bartonella sp. AR 15-3]OPB31109.1 hypothetical protein BAR153v2_000470 [Bartonella sp. AR 15-3]CBI78723.1 conserved exported hypothetical protein [Bartonella sp. AR 15-3]
MKKILSQILIVASILIYTDAFAGFGENKWEFDANTEAKVGKSESQKVGVIYSCNQLEPAATFHLEYNNDDALDRIKIVTQNPNQVVHNKETKTFIISNATSLEVRFPWASGPYTFRNMTGTKVIGSDCDIGEYN